MVWLGGWSTFDTPCPLTCTTSPIPPALTIFPFLPPSPPPPLPPLPQDKPRIKHKNPTKLNPPPHPHPPGRWPRLQRDCSPRGPRAPYAPPASAAPGVVAALGRPALRHTRPHAPGADAVQRCAAARGQLRGRPARILALARCQPAPARHHQVMSCWARGHVCCRAVGACVLPCCGGTCAAVLWGHVCCRAVRARVLPCCAVLCWVDVAGFLNP